MNNFSNPNMSSPTKRLNESRLATSRLAINEQYFSTLPSPDEVSNNLFLLRLKGDNKIH